jgi:hypothetical protein
VYIMETKQKKDYDITLLKVRVRQLVAERDAFRAQVERHRKVLKDTSLSRLYEAHRADDAVEELIALQGDKERLEGALREIQEEAGTHTVMVGATGGFAKIYKLVDQALAATQPAADAEREED